MRPTVYRYNFLHPKLSSTFSKKFELILLYAPPKDIGCKTSLSVTSIQVKNYSKRFIAKIHV